MNLEIKILLLLIFVGTLTQESLHAQQKQEDDDVAIYNSYIDQEYYFRLWGNIGKEQQKILQKKFRARKASEKATTQSDQQYWKDLAESERKLVHYFQEFYKQGQNSNNYSSEQTNDFLQKMRADPNMSKEWKLAPEDLEEVTKSNVRDVYGDIRTRRETLQQNNKAVSGIFDNGIKTFNPKTKDLLGMRNERLDHPLPILNRDYNEDELKVIAEHLETYPDIKTLFTLSCIRKSQSHNDCQKDYKKYDEFLNESVRGKYKKEEIATLFLRDFKRAELDQIKQVENEIKKLNGPEGEPVPTGKEENPDVSAATVEEENFDDLFQDIEFDFSPTEYEIPYLEGRKGDRFFLSTDKKCGGVSKGVKLGFMFTPAVLEEKLRGEGQEVLTVGKDIVPLFNCVKRKNILSTVKPQQECAKDASHIIGYTIALKRMEFEVDRKNKVEGRSDYVAEDIFHTIVRYQNTKSFLRFYAHQIPAKAPTELRDGYKQMIERLGYNREEGPLFVIYKTNLMPHLNEIYRCRFKKNSKVNTKINSNKNPQKNQDKKD